MAEKRDLRRKRKRIKIRFGLNLPSKIGFSDDLSVDGIFIKTASPEKPGLLLNLELTLSDESLVVCRARVHWAKRVPSNMLRLVGKGGMGVHILSFSQGQLAYKEFVESLLR